MHGAQQHLLKCTPHSPPKIYVRSCMRAYATVQKLLCHISYCELILVLARATCRLLFSACSCRPSCCLDQTRRPDAVCSRNPSKFTLAHDAVAAAVSHKHHSIICVGAGLIQFVYGSHSRLDTELTHHRNIYSPFFARLRKEGQTSLLLIQFSWHD